MDNLNDQLRAAAFYGDAAKLQALLLNPKCDTRSKDGSGVNALILAACGGHEACLQLLLPVSDALAKDNTGWTALMYAASYGQASCLSLLLPVSDILAKSDQENTASHLATDRGHTHLVMLIDAYVVAQSEKLALDSFIPPVASQKNYSLRI